MHPTLFFVPAQFTVRLKFEQLLFSIELILPSSKTQPIYKII
jgi:hypothetical protein